MNLRWNLVIAPYGDRWRHGRKLLHAFLHAGSVTAYEPFQINNARRFVCDLLAAEPSRPKDKLDNEAKATLPGMVRANFGRAIIQLTYGIDVRGTDSQNKYVGIPEAVIRAVNEAAAPGRFLVNFFPWC